MPTITNDGIYYVDLSTDPLFSPGTFTSVYPEALEFSSAIRNIGNCSFQLSYSSLDQDGAPAVVMPVAPEWVPFIGPYRNYYRLRCGNIAIQAGVITKTGATLGADYMSITGKTWEHILERWQYPFDPRTNPDHTQDYQFTNAYQNDELIASGALNGGSGQAYQASNRDVILIWSDIMSQMMNSVPNRIIFDISQLASGLSTIKQNYALALGESTSMWKLISEWAETGQGFDFWVSWTMKVYWASPYRFGPTSNPNIFYYLDSNDTESGFLQDFTFANNGPSATHVLGKGAGLATSTQMQRAYGSGANQIEFSRLDETYDFGDVRNAVDITSKTRKRLSTAIQPQHEMTFSVTPGSYLTGEMDYWATWRTGRAIWATIDLGYHRVDSAQQLKSYQAKMDANGNVDCEWTIDQIYDTDPNAGTAEG